jgi:hypothetical protein
MAQQAKSMQWLGEMKKPCGQNRQQLHCSYTLTFLHNYNTQMHTLITIEV